MKHLPIKFHNYYIIGTLLISFFGPKKYYDYDKMSILIFMVLYLCIVNIGFYIGNRIKSTEYTYSEKKSQFIYSLLSYSLLIAVSIQFVNFIFLISEGKISLDLSALGSNYNNYYDSYNENKGVDMSFSRDFYFLLISSVPKFISLCLGFYYYKILERKEKILLILLLLLIFINETIAKGNQKSIGDIVIFGTLAFITTVDFKKHKMKYILFR